MYVYDSLSYCQRPQRNRWVVVCAIQDMVARLHLRHPARAHGGGHASAGRQGGAVVGAVTLTTVCSNLCQS
jgi:hypothetical protein